MTDRLSLTSPPDWESLKNFPQYWDKAGLPIRDPLKWAALYGNLDYQQILSTRIFFGSGSSQEVVRVATIWDGIDTEAYFAGPDYRPLIFHTAVFRSRDSSIDSVMVKEMDWPTLEEAWRGHFELVAEWEGKAPGSYSVMDWRFHPRIAAM